MKKLITILFLFILIIGGSGIFAKSALASKESYSVSAVLSEHQSEGIESFFDIRWTPSYTENFSIVITNNSDKDHTYVIQVNKARTNKNGIIDYSDSTAELDTSKYQLTKMIQLPKEITVGAGTSQKVEGRLIFPGKSFNGILMAGIHVSEKKNEKSESGVSNTVAYNLPFVVRGDIDTRPKAKLSLQGNSLDKFSTTQSSLDIHLSNDEARLLKESNFKAEIINKNGKVITTQFSTIDITPETRFIYPVKLPNDIKQGEYKFILKVTHAKDKWEFKEKFNITGEEAREIHRRPKLKNNYWIIYTILSIILFILLLFIYRKKNKTF